MRSRKPTRRELELEGDELPLLVDPTRWKGAPDELEDEDHMASARIYNDLELDELEERRYRLELALERVKAAIKQRREY